MWIKTANARMALTARRPTRLNRACGATLRGLRGATWVTIDGDRRDIVLAPGDQFVVDSAQPLLVMSLHGEAVIEVIAAAAPQRCTAGHNVDPRLRHAAARWLRQAWARLARPRSWAGVAAA